MAVRGWARAATSVVVEVAAAGPVAFGAVGGHIDVAVWHDGAECGGGRGLRVWTARGQAGSCGKRCRGGEWRLKTGTTMVDRRRDSGACCDCSGKVVWCGGVGYTAAV